MISGIFVKILSIALLIAVGIVLILGIGTLFKGGETSKKYSNKLMQPMKKPAEIPRRSNWIPPASPISRMISP